MRHLEAGVLLISAALLILLVRGDGKAAAPSALNLLHPADKSVVSGAGLSHIIVELSQPASLLVRLNGKLQENAKIKETIYHYSVRLDFGLNTLEVEASAGGTVLARDKRDLFFFSPIAKEKEIPQGFVSIPFHKLGSTSEKCRACHTLEPQRTDRAPPTPGDSTCYTCHKKITQFKQVHGPAALWNCLACHNSSSAPQKYTTPVPVRDLCYGCHIDQKNYFFSAQFQHGPTATGMCTICHNPHASDHEFWLKKEPWDLCTTCHSDKASGRHILAWGPTGDTHPTRGRPDPMKPEREFSCRSCHNPHASNAPKLWNFDATTAYQLCWTCHKK